VASTPPKKTPTKTPTKQPSNQATNQRIKKITTLPFYPSQYSLAPSRKNLDNAARYSITDFKDAPDKKIFAIGIKSQNALAPSRKNLDNAARYSIAEFKDAPDMKMFAIGIKSPPPRFFEIPPSNQPTNQPPNQILTTTHLYPFQNALAPSRKIFDKKKSVVCTL